jgi:hypothetical protein
MAEHFKYYVSKMDPKDQQKISELTKSLEGAMFEGKPFTNVQVVDTGVERMGSFEHLPKMNDEEFTKYMDSRLVVNGKECTLCGRIAGGGRTCYATFTKHLMCKGFCYDYFHKHYLGKRDDAIESNNVKKPVTGENQRDMMPINHPERLLFTQENYRATDLPSQKKAIEAYHAGAINEQELDCMMGNNPVVQMCQFCPEKTFNIVAYNQTCRDCGKFTCKGCNAAWQITHRPDVLILCSTCHKKQIKQ